MKNWLVIYHRNCADGFASAFICWQVLGIDKAGYFAAQYGEAPPDVSDRKVLIVDFSYPRETLIAMSESAESLEVIDHHKSARLELQGLDFCQFDEEHSGAMLTWNALGLRQRRPWFIDYVEDRDLWRFKLPHSKEANAAIASWPFDFEYWSNNVGAGCFDRAVTEGTAILRLQDKITATAAYKPTLIDFAGYKVPLVNVTAFISETGDRLDESYPFSITWFKNRDGTYIYSLRSRRADIDVSEIAKRFGGGGHATAAGFKLTRLLDDNQIPESEK